MFHRRRSHRLRIDSHAIGGSPSSTRSFFSFGSVAFTVRTAVKNSSYIGLSQLVPGFVVSSHARRNSWRGTASPRMNRSITS